MLRRGSCAPAMEKMACGDVRKSYLPRLRGWALLMNGHGIPLPEVAFCVSAGVLAAGEYPHLGSFYNRVNALFNVDIAMLCRGSCAPAVEKMVCGDVRESCLPRLRGGGLVDEWPWNSPAPRWRFVFLPGY